MSKEYNDLVSQCAEQGKALARMMANDGIMDAQAGNPPTPPAAPWKSCEQAIQAEYMDGYSQQGRARIEAEQAARDYCAAAGHRAHLIGHSRDHGQYIETQDPAGQWQPFWQELKQEPTA